MKVKKKPKRQLPWKDKKVIRVKDPHRQRGRYDVGFYNTAAWRKVSTAYRAAHPLCENCQHHGRITPAMVVDHIVPIRAGGAKLNERNLMSLCDARTGGTCHDRKNALEGRGVFVKSVESSLGGLVPANRADIFKLLK